MAAEYPKGALATTDSPYVLLLCKRMKSLLLHCKNYRMSIGLLANRPSDIKPEPVTETEHKYSDCILALITVEQGDSIESTQGLVDEITKMADDVACKEIVILPFAHLSSKLADSGASIPVLENIKDELSKSFNVVRNHFGSHKEYMIDVYGHPGNTRFREF